MWQTQEAEQERRAEELMDQHRDLLDQMAADHWDRNGGRALDDLQRRGYFDEDTAW